MFDRLRAAWHMRDTERRIRKHGWTAIYVGDYRSAPTWVYTVGFDDTLDQPEIVAFDLQQADAGAMLWQAFEELKSGELVLEDGKVWVEDEQARLVWRKVDPSQIDGPDGWFAFAVERRRRRTGRGFGLEVFQLVLADAERRMPWDDGYDERLRPLQPALWLPADDTGRSSSMSSVEREARRLVRERGWTSVAIEGPGFYWAYTIGLHETLGSPDLIMFGPDSEPMRRMLVEVQAHVRSGALTPSDGLRWDGLGFEVCFRPVHETQYLGFNWFYLAKEIREERSGKREAVPAFQLFISDDAGRYPWDEGCDRAMAHLQPQLFLPLEDEPNTRRELAAEPRV